MKINKNLILFIVIMIIALFAISCDKKQFGSEVITTTTRVERKIIQGKNSGKTFYSKSSSLTSKGDTGDGLFISNTPLVEFKYIQNVIYDSIVTQIIDEETQEVLQESIERPIISRDTIGFETGPLWQKFDAQNPTKVLIGLEEEYLEGSSLKIVFETIDNHNPEEVGLLFVLYTTENEFIPFAQKDTVNLSINKGTIIDSIPIFNEEGLISSYSSGVELTNLITKQYQINNIQELNREFKLTVISENDSEVSADFTFKYVPEIDYNNRQCWLNEYFECKEFY